MARETEAMPPLLQAEDLRLCYGNAVALDGVSFTVEAGEFFGLLGPNGAGKTSLLSVLAGLVEPTGGRVRVGGRSMTRGDRDARRLIGLVPQEIAVYGELTARENLEFFGELYGLRGGALRRRADEVLEAVGLTDRAGQRVETLSGGTQRRLNLGVALMHRPPLLLLDEPTVGVDPQSRRRIFDEVRRLNGDGVTVVYTSHYMEEVQGLCRRVGIIDHGRLVACDELPALLRRARGLIRLTASPVTPALRQSLARVPGVRPAGESEEDGCLTLECDDVKAALGPVMAAVSGSEAALHALEVEEPNLERVFFDLTHTTLRD